MKVKDPAPARADNTRKGTHLEKATFAAGCFWGVEDAFRHVPGVVNTTVGYTGGTREAPTYHGLGDHTEAVQIDFDPKRVSYEALLEVFWKTHDPTTPNRQGPDVGEQYRSAIFFHTREQEEKAKASKNKLQKTGVFNNPIVTEILPAKQFF